MPEPRIPNLFIIGAPKCGTTAMSHYLAQHPKIYMSEQAGNKEPEYFSTDMWLKKSTVNNWDDYMALFSEAPEDTIYIGEASVNYLTSRVAVRNILRVSPAAKFVVMLRNPIEVAQRLHNDVVRRSEEPLVRFEQAWMAQEQRSRGRNLPTWNQNARFFQYGERARLGSQLARLFSVASRDNVCVIIYDDFMLNPAREYSHLLNFLDVESITRFQFNVINSSSQPRLSFIKQWLVRIKAIRHKLGLPGGFGIEKAINSANARRGLAPLRPDFRRELQSYFRGEIEILSDLLQRDFRNWLV